MLHLAQKLAEEAAHGSIATAHLLAALASEPAGASGVALRAAGVDKDAVMAAVAAAIAERGGQPASGPPLPDPAVRDVIGDAFTSAGVDPATAGKEVIDTANLLRCTLRVRDESGVGAADVFGRLGVPEARVLARLPSP